MTRILGPKTIDGCLWSDLLRELCKGPQRSLLRSKPPKMNARKSVVFSYGWRIGSYQIMFMCRKVLVDLILEIVHNMLYAVMVL